MSLVRASESHTGNSQRQVQAAELSIFIIDRASAVSRFVIGVCVCVYTSVHFLSTSISQRPTMRGKVIGGRSVDDLWTGRLQHSHRAQKLTCYRSVQLVATCQFIIFIFCTLPTRFQNMAHTPTALRSALLSYFFANFCKRAAS